jgi:hypothetical protein
MIAGGAAILDFGVRVDRLARLVRQGAGAVPRGGDECLGALAARNLGKQHRARRCPVSGKGFRVDSHATRTGIGRRGLKGLMEIYFVHTTARGVRAPIAVWTSAARHAAPFRKSTGSSATITRSPGVLPVPWSDSRVGGRIFLDRRVFEEWFGDQRVERIYPPEADKPWPASAEQACSVLSNLDVEPIARMPTLARAHERPFVDQIGQVTCGGRRRRAGDGDVVLGAKAALEAFQPLAEQSRQNLLLPGIEAAMQAIMETRFGDQEVDQAQRIPLRIEDRLSEILKPSGDLQLRVALFKHGVVALATRVDGLGERQQR